jgi:hypothetical protein
MQLRCPNCSAGIPARQINVNKLVAVCERCDAVFSVDPATLPTAERKRRKVPQPEKFHVIESDGKLEMSYLFREHFGWLEVIMIIVVGLMNVAAFVGLGMFISGGQWLPVIGLLALIPFLLYVLVSYFTNRHVITLDANTLAAGELPLRTYFLDVEIDPRQIVRVFTKATGLDGNPADDYYYVMAQMTDQTERTILHYVKRQNAEFIAQMLDEYIQAGNEVLENPFVDDDDAEDTDDAAPGDGEITATEPDEDTSLSLEDLLRQERDSRRNENQ